MCKYEKLFILGVMWAGASGALATDSIYINHGYVLDAPQIDAAAFYNDGVFSLVETLPFSTMNTMNFTNRGVMTGAPGWQIDYSTGAGRQMMDNFVNEGTLEGQDFGGFTVITGSGGQSTIISAQSPASYILLSATNVTSRGVMNVGPGGLLKINAKKADLSRSAIRSGSALFSGTGISGGSDFTFNDGTNFIPAQGVFDVYWAVGTNQALVANRGRPLDLSTRQLNTPFPVSPTHEVQTVLGSSNIFSLVQVPFNPSTNRYTGFVYTNRLGASNVIIQVVLLATNLNSGSVQSTVKWAPGAGGARIPIVKIDAPSYDTALNVNVTNSLYLSDDIMTRSNSFISLNGNVLSGRPVNYRVSKSPLPGWTTATNSNSFFIFDNHILNFQWDNTTVTNGYTAYSFTIDQQAPNNLGSVFGNFPTRGFSIYNPFTPAFYDPTNLAGRVELHADELDLSRSRIRAQNYLLVDSPKTTIDQNTIIDAPYISLNMANPSGELNLENTIASSVDRISGQIYMWTGTWSNSTTIFGVSGQTTTSNTVNILQQVWVVDDENLTKSVDVGITEANLKATNIVISDPLQIVRGLRLEGDNVTVNSTIGLVQDLVNLGPTNFVGTVNLTNNGSIFNAGNLSLGAGATDPLAVFRNTGSWFSYSSEWDVDELINSGTIFALNGPLTLSARTGILEYGSAMSNFDVHLNFGTLYSSFSTVTAGVIGSVSGVPLLQPGKLYINVTNSLRNSAIQALWSVTDGFELTRKPITGDLTDARITSYGYQFREVNHKWAGEDRGLDPAGYTNNAALGTLVLDGQYLSTFTFDTVDGNNALYVKYLQLNNYATNWADAIRIKPGMKIYYGNLQFGTNVIAPTSLDGFFADAGAPDGRLRYLPAPIGDTVTVSLDSGEVISVTKGLIESSIVDSDGDGIVNSLDSTPFGQIKVDVSYVGGDEPKAVVSWNGAPRTTYELQVKDDITQSQWQTITNFTTYSDQRRINIDDPDGGGGHRFYRVNYTP
ncbi:hypothetical protein GC207_01155 [bacterium]|nr:hypothetical protein [bacterium]